MDLDLVWDSDVVRILAEMSCNTKLLNSGKVGTGWKQRSEIVSRLDRLRHANCLVSVVGNDLKFWVIFKVLGLEQ